MNSDIATSTKPALATRHAPCGRDSSVVLISTFPLQARKSPAERPGWDPARSALDRVAVSFSVNAALLLRQNLVVVRKERRICPGNTGGRRLPKYGLTPLARFKLAALLAS
jgi:hypothetical protein